MTAFKLEQRADRPATIQERRELLDKIKHLEAEISRLRGWHCIDCKGKPDCPQINASTWVRLSLGPRDLLCLECFERRLGRPIQWESLERCVMTDMLRKIAIRVVDGRMTNPA
jgi:hypothetical protein